MFLVCAYVSEQWSCTKIYVYIFYLTFFIINSYYPEL